MTSGGRQRAERSTGQVHAIRAAYRWSVENRPWPRTTPQDSRAAPWKVLADGSRTAGVVMLGDARMPPMTSGPSSTSTREKTKRRTSSKAC